MVFSSSVFLFFFLPAVLLFYYITPKRFRNLTLLLFSFIFYGWGQPYYLSLLITSIIINWLSGFLIDRYPARKKLFLIIAVTLNIALLGVFKYTDFAIEIANSLFHGNISPTNIILPIGISFYTFQGMSYVIDIYRGTCSACKNPLDTALYISLFPQLIAGPIVKYNTIHSQLYARDIDLTGFTDGIFRFVTGLSKKVLLANVLGETADNIFDRLSDGIDTPSAWLGIICYTLQIYFDFSGYSDMAIGLGKMFGFSFNENFNYPYISTSITEFWRRWHISLSSWFRDYLYIPLGGNRRGIQAVNILIVFFVTGLWHGASLNFIVWGLWYGFFLIIEKYLKLAPKRETDSGTITHMGTNKLMLLPKWVIVMLIVILGWVVFRAPDLHAAIKYIGIMFGAKHAGAVHFSYKYYLDKRIIFTVIIAAFGSLPVLKNFVSRFKDTTAARILRIPVMLILLALCIIFITNNVYNPFIYFQF